MTEPPDDDSLRGTDPLLANPIVATGMTGEIERPGDDRSPWVIGLLLAAFASLISGLATLALTRDDTSTAAEVAASAPASEVAVDDTSGSTVSDDGTVGSDGSDEAGTSPAATEPPDGTTETDPTTEPVDDAPLTELDGEQLPAPGFVRIGSETAAIEAACEVHLPLAPANNDLQVSSYLFRFDDGDPHVLDRRIDSSDGDGGVLEVQLDGDIATEVVVDGDGDESGAFLARFEAGTAVLNPDPAAPTSCGDSLVTNEPGQFAFPYSRIVLAACASGRLGTDLFASGVTSDGGRFAAQDNADGTVTLSYTTDELGSELLDPAASAFESDERLGYSGVVTNGAVTLDITIDFTPIRGGSPCVNALQG